MFCNNVLKFIMNSRNMEEEKRKENNQKIKIKIFNFMKCTSKTKISQGLNVTTLESMYCGNHIYTNVSVEKGFI